MSLCGGVDLSKTILAGMTDDQLRAWLASAQQAYFDFMTGGKPVEVTYTQGDGQKSVTYNKANIAGLTMLIKQIQIQLGIVSGRTAIRPYFSGR